jgi:hypothetical protein
MIIDTLMAKREFGHSKFFFKIVGDFGRELGSNGLKDSFGILVLGKILVAGLEAKARYSVEIVTPRQDAHLSEAFKSKA